MARRRRYTVKAGDTFASIAKRYGIDSTLIANANSDVVKLRAGTNIDVPSGIGTGRFGTGDTPWRPTKFTKIGGKIYPVGPDGKVLAQPIWTPTPQDFGYEPWPGHGALKTAPDYSTTIIGGEKYAINPKTGRVGQKIFSPPPQDYSYNPQRLPTTPTTQYDVRSIQSLGTRYGGLPPVGTAGGHITGRQPVYASGGPPQMGPYGELVPTPTAPPTTPWSKPYTWMYDVQAIQSETPRESWQDKSVDFWGAEDFKNLSNAIDLATQQARDYAIATGDYRPLQKYLGNTIYIEGSIIRRDHMGNILSVVDQSAKLHKGYPGTTGHGKFNYYPGGEGTERIDPMDMGNMSTAYGMGSKTDLGRTGVKDYYGQFTPGMRKAMGMGGGETTTATGGEGAGESVEISSTTWTPEVEELQNLMYEAGINNYTVPEDPNRSFAGFVKYDGNNIVVHKIDSPGVTEMMVNDYYKTEVAKLAGKPPNELTQEDWDTYGAQVEAFENTYDPYEGMYIIRTTDLPEGFDFEEYADKYGINYFSTGGGYVTQYPPTGFNKVPWKDSDPAYQTWQKDMDEIAEDIENQKYIEEQNLAFLARAEKAARGRAFAPRYQGGGLFDRDVGGRNVPMRRASARGISPLMWRI